jgi:hypothetical protein
MRTDKYADTKRVQPDFWVSRNQVSTLLLTMFQFWRCPHCMEVVWLGNARPKMEVEVFSGKWHPRIGDKPYGSVLHERLASSPLIEQLHGSEFIPPDALPSIPVKMAQLRLAVAELWQLIIAPTKRQNVDPRQFNRCLGSLLTNLAPEHPTLRILKAEGYRLLGRYEATTGLLNGLRGEWERIAVEIADLARQQQKGVVRLAL